MEVMKKIDEIILDYDLLKHDFYKAWTEGSLCHEDLKLYAEEYYHQVAAFPTFLSALHSRLPDGPFRRTVLSNLCEEEIEGRAHSEIWLDFAEGMGAERQRVKASIPSPSTQKFINTLRLIAQTRSPVAAVSAFYVYESQVARTSPSKAEGLQNRYGVDAQTSAYFVHHATWDQQHASVWAKQIERNCNEEAAEELFSTVKEVAQAMWHSLDGIYSNCKKNMI